MTKKEKEIDKMVEIAREYSKDIANTPYYLGVVTDMTALYEAKYRNGDEILTAVISKILCAIGRCEAGGTICYTKDCIQGLKMALITIGIVAKNAGLLTRWKDYKLSELFKGVDE